MQNRNNQIKGSKVDSPEWLYSAIYTGKVGKMSSIVLDRLDMFLNPQISDLRVKSSLSHSRQDDKSSLKF